MSNVKAKKVGNRWQAFYQVGCYWFLVTNKVTGRTPTYATAEAARAAAARRHPFRKSA